MGKSLTLIWADCEDKVEKVRWVWPGRLHRTWEVELGQVCVATAVRTLVPGARGVDGEWDRRHTPFCTLIWAALVFGLRFDAASSFFFMDQI